MRRAAFFAAAAVLATLGEARAAIHAFDFDTGLGPEFSVFSDEGMYSIDCGLRIRVSKPADDGSVR